MVTTHQTTGWLNGNLLAYIRVATRVSVLSCKPPLSSTPVRERDPIWRWTALGSSTSQPTASWTLSSETARGGKKAINLNINKTKININFSCKTQNIRNFNFSLNIRNYFKRKVDALTLEQDDIIMVSNTQIGRNRKILEDAFRFKGYEILTNSTSNAAKGVLIALRIAKDIKIIEVDRDEDDRILIVKTLIEGEEITAAAIYDTNLNSAIFWQKLEEKLEAMNSTNGCILGGDYNTITNIDTDQRGYNGEHARTFASAKLREWETSNKFMDPLRYLDKDSVIITYVPDSE